ncbi:MAG TPA: GNAT family N-acetyltransferase [Flavisolibacter sp.]|jgi:GNAT superfamily N-acetyltransferase|nr:GNAT family N-acetyltransferase [Flavisolibacter sp.]
MHYRAATIDDIQDIQQIRHAVKENVLSDPSLVTDEDCIRYITQRGKGWVCEENNRMIGSAIADLQDHNIWALFLRPEYEGKGIGRQLHYRMLEWYFSQTSETVWLSTEKGTRAEGFYRKLGWKEVGSYGKCEIKFEMTFADWQKVKNAHLATDNLI